MVTEETVLIYHTAAFPATRNVTDSDLLGVAHHGRRAYYHQLIAAARQVKASSFAPSRCASHRLQYLLGQRDMLKTIVPQL